MKIEQEFVEYVVKALVNKPEAVRVDHVIDERGVLLTLHVDDEDLGRVIGKGGLTAQSLRVLLRALGSKNEARYNLRIADGEGHQVRSGSREPRQRQPAADPVEEVAPPEPEPESPEPQSELEKVKTELADLDDLEL